MALTIETKIDINANTEKVWSILMDTDSYKDWNPFISSVVGNLDKGNKITIHVPGMKFKPKILVSQKEKELRWRGKLLFNGLFDGQHYFLLENNNGMTQFIHGEIFSGILVPLFKKKLTTETKLGFEAMNMALKKRAEL